VYCGHSVQAAELASEYVPGEHIVQDLDEVCPSFGEYVPAGHGVHAIDPAMAEYVPVGHGVHKPPGTEN
jgi:hypothetical protein